MANVFVDVNEVKLPARFIDTRFDLMNSQAGRALYDKGHIEGAIYMDLEQDCSAMDKEQSGRHPMPEKKQLQQWIEQNGLASEQSIYIYDQGGAPFAARAYYMLTYAGLQNVWIVNGGYEALVAAGYKVTADVPQVNASTFEPNWQENIYADRAFVRSIVEGKQPNTVLLDARAEIRYRGEHEPLDPVAGHIPTALNFDWEQLKSGKSLVVKDELLEKVAKDQEVVVYCGSGVTASPLYTVLKEAGYDNVRVYVGSYSDWITEHEVAIKKENN